MDELEYVAKAKAKDDKGRFINPEAIAVLIKNHHGFIRMLAKRYAAKSRMQTEEDFFNEGAYGLMEAIDKFDLSVSTKFLTYAGWYIRRRMQAAFRRKDAMEWVDPVPVEWVAVAPVEDDYIDFNYCDLDFSILTDQEKEVLRRHIVEDEYLAEIGRDFGLGRATVSLIKNRAIGKLQREIAINQIIPEGK